ncbi:MAG: MBOAT family protein [Betaproteobacteria bacterium]|nr:MAG: MBOAT family protein [Betaproteobacteria bacterium]
MTFDSLTFALFLAIVFPIYAFTPSWPARKNILLVASCVFYGSWNPIFLLLLAFTTVFDWWAALRIHAAATDASRKRWLWTSVIASLALLSYFKYAQFFTNTAIEWASWIGIKYAPIDLGIILPLGISFYIFESISYIVDVYKKRVTPTKSLRDYGLFMTFFPHLVAGPIMRYKDFNSQVETPRVVTADAVALGAYLMIGGLFLKIVGADHVFAPLSNQVFAADYQAGFVAAWAGAFSFSMQVFCDFAGYSLAAIGIAKMFGFHLPANFESPFASVGIAELWTRWHISLSNWLRDYVFNPLGHYRKGRWRGYLNVMITFTACGFWHGAAWHFVAWGAVHGAMLVIERMLKDSFIGAWKLWDSKWVRPFLALLTFALFSLAVVFFRAPDLAVAWTRVKAMFGAMPTDAVALAWNGDAKVFVIGLLVGLVVQAWLKHRKGWDWLPAIAWPLRTLLLSFMLLMIVLSPGKTAAFIYFQF